jgi:preprotein translocase subunit SecG
MYTILVVLHVLICLLLCVVVLLQSSKGGGLAGAFGGAGMPQQIFGTRGMTTLLHKLTIYGAVGFFITSAGLFALTAQRNRAPGSEVQEAARRGELSDVTPQTPDAEVPLPAFPVQEGATGESPAPAAEGSGQSSAETPQSENGDPSSR